MRRAFSAKPRWTVSSRQASRQRVAFTLPGNVEMWSHNAATMPWSEVSLASSPRH
jgi:hypothetical protein